MIKWFKNIGPGPLVAAAFIGPGTVTLCTIAGVKFGFALLWAMILSVVTTIILQEMAARVGIVTQKGLSEIIRTEIQHPTLKLIAVLLILSAIVIGNTAYEAGNISGAVLGLEAVFGTPQPLNYYSIIIGVIAFILLYIGNYKVIEKVLVALVIIMSLAFLITAIMTKPDFSEIAKGLFVPSIPKDALLTIVGLIGTTVVPYNLFLHASLVKEKWNNPTDLPLARKDTIVAIVLGGMISMCIIISAAAIQGGKVTGVADLAKGLEPLFGSFSKYVIAIGLFAAGITSAITAPLAAAYVANGCLGWNASLKSAKFRMVWMFILGIGVLSALSGVKSIEIIQFAQVANAILLPIIAVFLIWVVNKNEVLGKYKNTLVQNSVAFVVVAICVGLAVRSLMKVFGLL